MSDTSKPAPLPNAMQGEPVAEAWTPDQVLRADATNDQWHDRANYIGAVRDDLMSWECEWMATHEFAVAREDAARKESAVYADMMRQRANAAESALAAVRAENERLREFRRRVLNVAAQRDMDVPDVLDEFLAVAREERRALAAAPEGGTDG